MNMIQEIGISICVTAVAAAIFQGLMPKSSLENTARSVPMRSTLEKNNIEAGEIQVETTIGEDNSIIINRVIVSVSPDDRPAAESLAGALTDGDETRIEFRVSE